MHRAEASGERDPSGKVAPWAQVCDQIQRTQGHPEWGPKGDPKAGRCQPRSSPRTTNWLPVGAVALVGWERSL